MTSPNVPSFPAPTFAITPENSPFAIPPTTYLAQNSHSALAEGGEFTYLATSTLVFHPFPSSPSPAHQPPTPPKILLLQRSALDSLPNLWEPPGGATDAEDPSVLYSAARELWEETGLVASAIRGKVGSTLVFKTVSGNWVGRVVFLVDVVDGVLDGVEGRNVAGDLNVRVDPDEHQAFIWATEEEVRMGRVRRLEENIDISLDFTDQDVKDMVLEGFRMLKKEKA